MVMQRLADAKMFVQSHKTMMMSSDPKTGVPAVLAIKIISNSRSPKR